MTACPWCGSPAVVHTTLLCEPCAAIFRGESVGDQRPDHLDPIIAERLRRYVGPSEPATVTEEVSVFG